MCSCSNPIQGIPFWTWFDGVDGARGWGWSGGSEKHHCPIVLENLECGYAFVFQVFKSGRNTLIYPPS